MPAKATATAAAAQSQAKNGAAFRPGVPLNTPPIPAGATVLQVAALVHEADALAMAEALQQKKFPAFVLTPGDDHFYRVQVGPYPDAKSANAARQGLENRVSRASSGAEQPRLGDPSAVPSARRDRMIA